MKLTPVSFNPFDEPAKRVARAEGGLMRTAPFPEKPEGYEFYSDDAPGNASSGVEPPQNDIPAQEGVSPGVTAGVGQMIKGVGDWIATPKNMMSGVEQVQPEVPGQWSEEDQYRQQLANAAQSQKEIAFGGETALNLFGTSAPFVPRGTVGIAGGRPPPAVSEAPQIAQPFYSGVERAVADIPQGKASGEQWLATLRNRPGVKPEEMEWTGIEDWLKEQKGPVTKQQVLDHIAENKIEVQEVLRGPESAQARQQRIDLISNALEEAKQRASVEPTLENLPEGYKLTDEMKPDVREYPWPGHWSVYNTDGGIIAQGGSREQALANARGLVGRGYGGEGWSFRTPSSRSGIYGTQEEAANHLLREAQQDFKSNVFRLEEKLENAQYHEEPISNTKFSQWQLPGGENYREMLLTLPEKSVPSDWQVVPHPENPRDGFAIKNVNGEYGTKANGTGVAWFPKEEIARQAIEDGSYAATQSKGGDQFHSSHWDEPNVLAHIRFNDRVIDGKKTLFIEEVQSDFGEATRSAKAHIAEAVDRDFDNIADKMVKDGLITKVCD